jgi:iron-sulfur cluster assembly protein CyaY
MMTERLNEAEFQSRAEVAIQELEQAFGELADDRDIDVQVEGGVLSINFEEGEPGKFIVSPNSSARQVWVSARVSSFKFGWSDEAGEFVLAGANESLRDVMTRLTREQLGDVSITL